MKPICPDIEEENFIDEINDIAEGGNHLSGECRGNLSFWNPGQEYKSLMGAIIDFKPEQNIFDYRYSFTLGKYKELPIALGCQPPFRHGHRPYAMVTPSSSYSVVAILQLLKAGGICHLGIVAPYYYSVRPVAADLGLNVEILEQDAVREFQGEALWLTSPVYGTGEAFTAEFKETLKQLHRKRHIALVFDESLALPGTELCREFPIDLSTFFIYSPHKAISVNAVKFSCAVFEWDYRDSADNRQDMYVGALSNSNIEAVNHYLTGNYKTACVPAYKDFVEKHYLPWADVVKASPFAHLASGHSGHYHTVFTSIPLPSKEDYLRMLRRLFADTGFIFYPTDVYAFHDQQATLSFRVNILTDSNICLEGTQKVLDWLWHTM